MSGIYLQCTISIVVFVSVFVAVVLFQNALKTFAEAGKEDDEDIRKGGQVNHIGIVESPLTCMYISLCIHVHMFFFHMCAKVQIVFVAFWVFMHILDYLYRATSIIRTSFIRTLDYPDQLEIRNYITTHVQKAWPMIFCGCGHRLSDELWTLQTCLGQTGLLDYFSEHCWPWSYCLGIVYRLGIINQVINVGALVIWTFN